MKNRITSDVFNGSSSQLQRIDDAMQRYVDKQEVAGLVAMIIQRGQLTYEGCYGVMEVESAQSMRADAIFRIASMIKPITTVAVLMLHEEGGFQLGDPVASFIPAFKESNVWGGVGTAGLQLVKPKHPITIRHLLIHTSGMCLSTGVEDPVDALYYKAVADLLQRPGINLQQAVDELATLPLAHQPGSAWRYSLSFEVLARLVEVLSGEWFDVFLQQRIFEPLGMVNTSYVIPSAKVDRLTALYAPIDSGGLKLIDAAADSPHVKFFGYEPDTVWTSGGSEILSTAADYARFVQLLLNGGTLNEVRLLSPQTVALMTRNHLSAALLPVSPQDAGFGHGLGVRVLMEVNHADSVGSVGEFSGSGGHGTYFWTDPEKELIGLLMLQLNPNRTSIHREFKTAVYQVLDD